jgi:hypothetical protein
VPRSTWAGRKTTTTTTLLLLLLPVALTRQQG